MYFRLSLLTIAVASGLESCRDIALSGAGGADGYYSAPTDYRGRPDFFTEDGNYNLFGEEEFDECYWRIDTTVSEFPFWISYDCSYHPVDIETEWLINLPGLDPEVVSLQIACTEPKASQKWKLYAILTAAGIATFGICVWGHLRCRRQRIQKSKRECAVCRKKASEAAKVVGLSFSRRPSV